MSGSVSPLPWTGNKGCIYTTIDAFMPPHRTYVEACMGSAEVFLRKKPVEKEIINDYNGDLVRLFRVLQRNENLERLIGRLFLSFNSEQIFRANKALLAEVPNILDDLTETSVIIENTQWNDFDLAVAFYENQVFSFSSTGKNFAITKKDMTKRFGRLIAACARLRNATIMHRDYKDCISYGAGEDAFILLDPPYKGTEDYYQKSSFGSDEHAKLFGFMNEVHEQFHGSCKFLITYNNDPYIRELADHYGFDSFVQERLHNMRQATKPGDMFEELLIGNYYIGFSSFLQADHQTVPKREPSQKLSQISGSLPTKKTHIFFGSQLKGQERHPTTTAEGKEYKKSEKALSQADFSKIR